MDLELEKLKKTAARAEFERDVLLNHVEQKDRRIRELEEQLRQAVANAATVQAALAATQRMPVPPGQAQALEKRFLDMIEGLRRELHQLRTTYPLQALLSAKDAEVERVRKGLVAFESNHPDRPKVEAMLREHLAEREHIRRLVDQAEQVLKYQDERLTEVAREITLATNERSL